MVTWYIFTSKEVPPNCEDYVSEKFETDREHEKIIFLIPFVIFSHSVVRKKSRH